MGCIIEVFMEVIFEGLIEGTFALYTKMTRSLLPQKKLSEKDEEKLNGIIGIIFACTLMVLVVGITFITVPELSNLKPVGRYMVFIPLAIWGVQIVLNIIIAVNKTIYKKIKNKKNKGK